MKLVPTCDDTESPTLKALVHGGTVLIHLIIAAYHIHNFRFHWRHR